jgi:hypothetical protein
MVNRGDGCPRVTSVACEKSGAAETNPVKVEGRLQTSLVVIPRLMVSASKPDTRTPLSC